MSFYVIAGATGHIGAVAARELLSAGHKVRAIVRDEQKGAALRALGAELAIGDLNDAGFLGKALTGATAAMLLLPPNVAAPDVRAAQRQGLDAQKAAIAASGIGYVVYVSSLGAEQAVGTGPIVGLHWAEQELPATGAKFTFVRAASFMENLLGMLPAAQHQGVLPNFTNEHFGVPLIATQDIGRLVARSLLNPPSATEVVYLIGSIEYKPADQAAVLAKLLGKPVSLMTLPVSAAAGAMQQAGLPASMSSLYQEMYEAAGAGLLVVEAGHRVERGTLTLEEALTPYFAKA